MQILKGHISAETAYLVDDYPYGFRLRCKIRYWLEYKPGFGFRFMSQTTNPKRGDIWNKPKGATYCKYGACMFLNEEGHCVCAGLTEYGDTEYAVQWKAKYYEGVPDLGKPLVDRWIAAKQAYDAMKAAGKVKTLINGVEA